MSALSPSDIDAVVLSLKVSAVATVCALPFAILTALALARGRFAGKTLFSALVHLPLVLPPVATGYALLVLFGRNGPIGEALGKIGIVFAFDWTGAALASGVMAFPLIVGPIRVAIETIDREVGEVAATLGATPVQRFIRLTLPLSSPGLLAGGVLGFAKALGEFGATITFVGQIPGVTMTLPSAIHRATQVPGGEPTAVWLCVIAVILAVGAILASDLTSKWVARRIG